jgi:hypothetical protein
MVVFKLTTTPSFRPSVHNVHGELVLRDGLYASEADVLLRLQVGHPAPQQEPNSGTVFWHWSGSDFMHNGGKWGWL